MAPFSLIQFWGCGGKITCLPPNQTVVEVVGPYHHGNRSTSILWEKLGGVDHVFDVDSTLLWGRNIGDREKAKHSSSFFLTVKEVANCNVRGETIGLGWVKGL